MNDFELIEKVKRGLKACFDEDDTDCHADGKPCPYLPVIGCHKKLKKDTLSVIESQQKKIEQLKGYEKAITQLKELQTIENSRVKECDGLCDWDAKHYHEGKFDAYSIAIDVLEQKDGDGDG